MSSGLFLAASLAALWRTLAGAALVAGDGDAALLLLERGGVHDEAGFLRAEALRRAGRLDEATALYVELASRSPASPAAVGALWFGRALEGGPRDAVRSGGLAYAAWRAERAPFVGGERISPRGLARLFYPDAYADLIEVQAERWGLDPFLLFAVVRQESGFNPLAHSRAGAIGLMQVMPETARWLSQIEPSLPRGTLWDPEVNLAFGAAYLSRLLERYEGDLSLALAAYNAGPSAVDRWRRRAGEDWLRVAYPETRAYVRGVERALREYRRLYGGVYGEKGSSG